VGYGAHGFYAEKIPKNFARLALPVEAKAASGGRPFQPIRTARALCGEKRIFLFAFPSGEGGSRLSADG